MISLKKGEGVPLSNFEGGPGVPVLNFRGVPGPTFKLWGGSQVPGPRVPRSRILGSWPHFYTMPSPVNLAKFLRIVFFMEHFWEHWSLISKGTLYRFQFFIYLFIHLFIYLFILSIYLFIYFSNKASHKNKQNFIFKWHLVMSS